ncbi:hypothetical protein [Xenorhabdus entomophaga]|uniref:hypothetical protein n=1 Tax=Xenorhabdus entomophaga TaxID=3136257 RepID=UPI0030F4A194
MEHRKLKKEYKAYGFIKSQLEECLGFSLGNSNDFLPDYLKPYKTRIGIQLQEAANILAGCKPNDVVNGSPLADIVMGYRASLWDAYDNDILSGSDVVTEYGYNEAYRVDVTLVKDQITKWAKEYNLDWPFTLSIIKNNHDEKKIDNLLMQIESLNSKNNQLKTEIEILKSNQPSLLGNYRVDDPLLIAIKLRNEEWTKYNEDLRDTIPVQEWAVEKLLEEYKQFGMTKAQAQAIEKVACPIKRK